MFSNIILPALCVAGLASSYQIIPRQEVCLPESGGIVQIHVSTNVVSYPVYINTYITTNTTININGGVTININNAPTQIDTTLTATATETFTSTVTVAATVTATAIPFILLAEPISIAKRQITYYDSYVGSYGKTTSNCSEAAIFTINEGQLYSGGEPVSTNPGVEYQPFGVSPIIGEITEEFESYSGYLTWNNTAFYRDTASFCSFNGTVEAVFYGNMTSSCTTVNLAVIPAAACVVPVVSSSSVSALPTSDSYTSSIYSNATTSTSVSSSSSADADTTITVTIPATTTTAFTTSSPSSTSVA